MVARPPVTKYIYPPRAKQAFPYLQDGRRSPTAQLLADDGWLAQLKFNDSRCLLKCIPGQEPQLWSRHAEPIKSYKPTPEFLAELHTALELLGFNLAEYQLLDGGLLHCKHKALKDSFVLWDVLVRDRVWLLDTTYLERYQQLVPPEPQPYFLPGDNTYPAGMALAPHVFVPYNLPPDRWDEAWEFVHRINQPYDHPLLEGLVYKAPQGRLERAFGEQNNATWQAKSRVPTGRSSF